MTAHSTPKPRSETPGTTNAQPQAAPAHVHRDGVVDAPLLRRVTAGPGARLSPRDVHALQPLIGNRAVGKLLARGGGPAKASGRAAVPDAGGNQRPDAPRRGEAMPRDVQDQMESVFRADFSAVRVHEGPRPAAIDAIAFTEGTDIHIAPGLYQPHSTRGLELLGHELTHVIQQSQGRVRATMQAKGVGINDDLSLEREADACGVRAARGEPVAAWIGPMGAAAPVAQRKVIQRAAVKTDWGTFKDEHYTTIVRDDKAIGVDMHLSFEPNDNVNAEKIGLVQSVRSMDKGALEVGDPRGLSKVVKGGSAAGYETDRKYGYNNPIFGTDILGKGEDLSATPHSDAAEDEKPKAYGSGANTSYVLGYRYEASKEIHKRKAELHDMPKIPLRSHDAVQEFETTALALAGEQQGHYYGSVKWGWETDKDGNFSKIELSLVSNDDPSQNFVEPAKLWNAHKVKKKIKRLKNSPGLFEVTSSMTVSNKGYSFTVGPGTVMSFAEKKEPLRGFKTASVRLDATFQLLDGGEFWMCTLPENTLEGDVVMETTSSRLQVDDIDEAFTIEKGATVDRRGSPADGKVVVCLKKATVTTSEKSVALREVEALKLEVMAGEIAKLPIPSENDESEDSDEG